MTQWSAIGTAPRDWPVIVFCPQEQNRRRLIMIGAYSDQRHCWIAIPGLYRIRPTKWIPLPALPTTDDSTLNSN
jgi:hypothetical protein